MKYLISFPAAAMVIPPEGIEAVSVDSHAAIQQAKDAGVYVFGGGLNSDVPSLMVSADGSTSDERYPQTRDLDGGFLVLELPDRAAAVEWAARIAAACRAPQEVREFGYDPES